MISIATIPEIRVDADGEDLAEEAAATLSQVRVSQRLSVPALCELVFLDPVGADGELLELPEPGQSLSVEVGDADDPLFEGDVTAVEHVHGPDHAYEVRVRAYDRLHRLRKNGEPRVFEDVSFADVAAELADAADLSAESEDDGPTWATLIQHRQTDYELLTELAARVGLYATVRGDTLHLITLEGLGDDLDLHLGGSLLEASIEVNGDPACRSVSVAGWNPLSVEVHEGNADSPRSGRDVDAEVSPDDVGGSGEITLPDEVAADDEHAESLAQAELDVRAAREVVLSGVAEGDARLRPGVPVNVSGVDERIAGRYVLTSVTHSIDDRQGYVSELSTLPPRVGKRPRGAVVALAEVTAVDDPDGLGRVRATLPAYDDVETDWMGVLTVGAGPSKGLIVTPDVGDRVLVLFAREDPAFGVVLGGLYGTGGAPDSGVEDGAVRRYTLLTPGGHRLTLDDELVKVHLEDTTGSFIELSTDSVLVHAERDLTLDAPARAVLVRAKSVDFETAG
jgi:phage protein D/phage baseplate assembly protein gpV